MKAIITKIIPCTHIKPTRIKASAEGVPSKIYSKNQLEQQTSDFGVRTTAENIQRHAALLFRDAHDWNTSRGQINNLATGQLPNGDWVHCFIPHEEECILKVAIVDEEANPSRVIKRVATVKEAELHIETLKETQPEKVHRGGFGIDA